MSNWLPNSPTVVKIAKNYVNVVLYVNIEVFFLSEWERSRILMNFYCPLIRVSDRFSLCDTPAIPIT